MPTHVSHRDTSSSTPIQPLWDTTDLTAYRDHLRDLLEGGSDGQIAYYARVSELRRARRLDHGGFGNTEGSQALPSPAEPEDGHDDLPTPEQWRKLKAELTHDYGLRRLEGRGVKYEDEVERELDHAARRVPSPGDLAERVGPPSPRPAVRHTPRHKL